jgi:hypothetical protein
MRVQAIPVKEWHKEPKMILINESVNDAYICREKTRGLNRLAAVLYAGSSQMGPIFNSQQLKTYP